MGLKQYQNAFEPTVVALRCPVCRKEGSFHGVTGGNGSAIPDAFFVASLTNVEGKQVGMGFKYGVRVCPNPECREPLFVVLGNSGKIFRSYPAERLDFEPTAVPPQILANFEEVISCHAGACYRAAAIMVRRTLEEICADRGAEGKNLKDKIAALGTKIMVPKELLEAADELRMLGNDAAHLEASLYDEIGKEEVEVAIELSKEILKAVYQLSSLVGRLRALKSKG